MFIDDFLEFWDAQSFVTQAGVSINSDYLDLGGRTDWAANTVAQIGIGTPIWLQCIVGTAAAADTGASATLAVIAQHSTDATTWHTLTGFVQSAATPANFPAGTVIFNGPLPSLVYRYIRLRLSVATKAMTAGTLDAFLSLGSAVKEHTH